MGMTWKIKAELPYGDLKNLTDDMTFDRERLGTWMGLTREDWNHVYDDGYAVLTPAHVQNAIDVLTALVDKVKSMPFTENDPAGSHNAKYSNESSKIVREYSGSSQNIAILKEVECVLNKPYHFNFPWEKCVLDGEEKLGVPHMIEALEDVKDYMNRNPAHNILGFYF